MGKRRDSLHRKTNTLQELAQRLADSDADAYTELYRRMEKPLVRYIQRITRDTSAAYDVLQDVFMKLWEDRATLEVRVSIKALLYTMSRNRALNMNRQKTYMARVTVGTEMPVPHAVDPQSDEALVAKDLAKYLHQWINELPPRRAEAFVLSRYHGLKHSEISDIMELSERTVNTHILHALRDLRKRFVALQKQV